MKNKRKLLFTEMTKAQTPQASICCTANALGVSAAHSVQKQSHIELS